MEDFIDEKISKILKALSLDNLKLCVGDSKSKLIVLYDDFEFTQIDFDIIDGKTRNLLLAAFKKNNYLVHSAKRFSSPEGEEYLFAKPSHTLGANPATNVLEALTDGASVFCTPTQAILVLAAFRDTRLKDEDFLRKFLLLLPANIKKISQWIKHDKLKDALPHSESKMQLWNEEGASKRRRK